MRLMISETPTECSSMIYRYTRKRCVIATNGPSHLVSQTADGIMKVVADTFAAVNARQGLQKDRGDASQ